MSTIDIPRVQEITSTLQSGAMAKGWRERLAEAIDQQDRSMRDISLEAGLSETYVSELFRKGTEPTIGKLQAICEALEVSFTWIAAGVAISPDLEKALRGLANVSDAERARLVRQFPGASASLAADETPEPKSKRPRASGRTGRPGPRR